MLMDKMVVTLELTKNVSKKQMAVPVIKNTPARPLEIKFSPIIKPPINTIVEDTVIFDCRKPMI